jgi:hypothetical protein
MAMDDNIPFEPFTPTGPLGSIEPAQLPERKKRGPKKGSKRKPRSDKASFVAPTETTRLKVVPEAQRPLSLTEAMALVNEVNRLFRTVSPAQRKELLTYLLDIT